jgi:hypothetical protein
VAAKESKLVGHDMESFWIMLAGTCVGIASLAFASWYIDMKLDLPDLREF